MKWHMLTATLFGFVLAPGFVQAQIRLPVYTEETGIFKKVVYQEATQGSDFQHGKLLRVTLAGPEAKTVRGVLVRVDRATGKIYLRTEPGMPPRAFAEKDIKHVDKGVIFVSDSSKKDVIQPEIQPIEIYNGNKKTIAYSAPTLSPGEKSRLAEMESSENEVARLETLARLQDKVLENDVALQSEQLRAQTLMNDLLWKRQAPGGYQTTLTTNPNGNNNPYGYNGINFYPYANQGYDTINTTFMRSSYTTGTLPFVRVGPVFPGLPASVEALTKARASFTLAQNRAVFENGQLVAVIVDDQ